MQQRDWYVIQCKARESFRAAEHLGNQGYEIFHPVITAEHIRRGRLVHQEEPLFPYYLFIHLSDLTDNWRPIRSTRGVLKLVTFGQLPVKVDAALIEQLKLNLQPGVAELLQPGDEVLIQEGPFKGLKAIFQKKKGEERVILLLELLHKHQRLEVAVGSIKPLN